jgi:hypothetical protein
MRVKQTFCIREDQLISLKQLSTKTGAPMAELLRRALDHYFILQRKQEKEQNASKPAA